MSRRNLGARQKSRILRSFADAGRRLSPGFYDSMFMEDICTGIMGYRVGRNAGQSPEVLIHAGEVEVKLVRFICASLARSGWYSASEAVESAIEAVARTLAWYGQASYEICSDSSGEKTLESIPPHRLFRLPGRYIQVAPRGEFAVLSRQRIAMLPMSQAWVIKLPRSLGGAARHRRLIRTLNGLHPTGPEFFNRDLSAGIWEPSFRFGDYRRIQAAAVTRMTRHWGWNRRDASYALETEFYYYNKAIRFRRAQAILRDHIVNELNKLLVRLGISAKIELKGFLRPEEISQLIVQSELGGLHYVEAFQRASGQSTSE